ncbi:MAG: FliM/FliN family flagellar motor switch protein, partial [Paracoccaceae bacterium]
GLALLNAQAMAAVIEQMTTGRVVPSQADLRTATRTDAVIVATILDRILEIFDEGLAQVTDAPPVAGYRQSVSLEDGRAITMALEDMPYRLYRLALDFGRGAKTGELSLIFPDDPSGRGANASSVQARWRANWRNAVMQSEVLVEAVLHRFTIPLDELGNLEVGTFVPIPLECVSRVSLEGSDRRSVATGKLGQCNGHRAVRVAAGSATEQPATSEMSTQDFATRGGPPAANLESETVPMDTGEAPPPGALGSDDANSDPSGDAAMPQMDTAL